MTDAHSATALIGEAERSLPLVVHGPSGRRLPPLRRYCADLWRRRSFVVHLARATVRSQNADSALGSLWVVLNPLLLAGVYFFLVSVALDARQGGGLEYLAQILGALFAFYFTRNVVLTGGRSVLGGGRLVMNSSFPRLLLPISSAVVGVMQFGGMLAVYAIVHVAAGLPTGPELLVMLPVLALQAIFSTGLAMLLAVVVVYQRDVGRALPYFTRIWLYASPVLWVVDDLPRSVAGWAQINPLYPFLATWHDVVVLGVLPSTGLVVQCTLWAVATLLLGALLFVSREHDFAIRL